MYFPGKEIQKRYVLVERLGFSEKSHVFLARDLILGKNRIIKLLTKENFSEAMFYQKLEHPLLPQIFDLVEEKEAVFLVLQYIPGQTLDQLFQKNGSLPEKWLIAFSLRLCSVMEYLHSQNPPVLHGDIKPSNLLLSSFGQPFLIDLGSAVQGVSKRKRLFGTRGFAPPEQYQGHLFPCSDIYALGKTLACLGGASLSADFLTLIHDCCLPEPSLRIPDFFALHKRLREFCPDLDSYFLPCPASSNML
ncbi:MAG: serine/threonine-protein kinase [Eubacteriales bacterium]|nr:serine/threonine-protein kinase [Eubacteriales bacterium]